MANYLISPKDIYSAIDDNGNPLTGGQLFTYIAGSSTPADTFTDASGNTKNDNPIILDSRGEAPVWLDDTLVYKFVLRRPASEGGGIIRTTDNIRANNGGGGIGLSFVTHSDSDTISLDGLGTAGSPLIANALISSITSNALSITTSGGGGMYVADLSSAVATLSINKLDKVNPAPQSVVSPVAFNDTITLNSTADETPIKALGRNASNQVVEFTPTDDGENNTSSNVGVGLGFALPKVGVDLPFKSITASGGASVTTNGTEINIDATTTSAGVLSNVYFQAEEVTLATGTFYEVSESDKGLLSISQDVVVNDNQQAFFAQDFISDPYDNDGIIRAGKYKSELTVEASSGQALKKFTIEVYLCENDGTPKSSGAVGEPIGDLGVQVISIMESASLSLVANDITQLGLSAILGTDVPRSLGERIRFHVSAEKVGIEGAAQTLSLYSGLTADSFVEVPVTITTNDVVDLSSVTSLGNQTSVNNTLNTNKLDKIDATAQSVASTVDFDGGIRVDGGYFGGTSPQLVFGDGSDSYIFDNADTNILFRKSFSNSFLGAVQFGKDANGGYSRLDASSGFLNSNNYNWVDTTTDLAYSFMAASNFTGSNSESEIQLVSGNATTGASQTFSLSNLLGGGVDAFNFTGAKATFDSGVDVTGALASGNHIEVPNGGKIGGSSHANYVEINPNGVYLKGSTGAVVSTANGVGSITESISNGSVRVSPSGVGISTDYSIGIDAETIVNINAGALNATSVVLDGVQDKISFDATIYNFASVPTGVPEYSLGQEAVTGNLIKYVDGAVTTPNLQQVTDEGSVTTNGATFGGTLNSNGGIKTLISLTQTNFNSLVRNGSGASLYVRQMGSGDIQVWTAGDSPSVSAGIVAKIGADGRFFTQGDIVTNSRILQGGVTDDGTTGIQGTSAKFTGNLLVEITNLTASSIGRTNSSTYPSLYARQGGAGDIQWWVKENGGTVDTDWVAKLRGNGAFITKSTITADIPTGTQVGLVGYDATGKLIQGSASGGSGISAWSTFNLGNIEGNSALSGVYQATLIETPADIAMITMEVSVDNYVSASTVTVAVYNEAGTTKLKEATASVSTTGFINMTAFSAYTLTGGTKYWIAMTDTHGSNSFGSKTGGASFPTSVQKSGTATGSFGTWGLPTSIAGGTATTTAIYMGVKA